MTISPITKLMFIFMLIPLQGADASEYDTQNQVKTDLVSTRYGELQGRFERSSGVKVFKGVPFATPPVGALRWRAPQASLSWKGVRQASEFSARCMQTPIYSDMQFRSPTVSEDCLYLNIWAPLKTGSTLVSNKKLPVLLYLHGGGFVAGDASEPRYDGTSMAKQGLVVVTANYRLGIFGFMAHPQLSAESGYGGSGNYAFMDQIAALRWVVDNIGHFGGDPARITIAGESAGAISVSALMASPHSRNYIAGVIGQSGSILGPTLGTIDLAQAELQGLKVGRVIAGELTDRGPVSIHSLRSVAAEALLSKTIAAGMRWFMPTIDRYVFPRSPALIYQAGEFAKVPVLAGANSQEGSHREILADQQATSENLHAAIKSLYPTDYQQVSKLYNGQSPEQIMDAAQALASDRFISFSTWNWLERVSRRSKAKNYYYEYAHIRPPMRAQFMSEPKLLPELSRGAVHSAEIEYALGNLAANNIYQWQQADVGVSKLIQQYFVNFIKTGNPNGPDMPTWPSFEKEEQLVINENPYPKKLDQQQARYEFHRQYYEQEHQKK